MADVAVDPQNSNPKELFSQGVRAYVLQDFEAAVGALSQASELLSAEHGNDTHDSLGDVYLYYGKALLELSRRESGPLGDGVLKTVDEGSESEEVEEVDEESDDKTETVATEKDGVEVNGEADETTKTASRSDEAKDETKSDDASAGGTSKEEELEKKEGEENDDPNDLQVAWEVVELAKRIFTTRGQEGRKNLAEALIVLGEISLESGNYSSAIEDIGEGLKLQKTVYGNDSRTIAETYYKLGGALATNGQIDEAIENFNNTHEYLKNKVTSLQKDEEHKETNAGEIEELSNLIPEVEEKILDMKNLKLEVAKKLTSVNEAAPSTNGSSEASSSKPATDISHLVKRKRKDNSDGQDENPTKKLSPS